MTFYRAEHLKKNLYFCGARIQLSRQCSLRSPYRYPCSKSIRNQFVIEQCNQRNNIGPGADAKCFDSSLLHKTNNSPRFRPIMNGIDLKTFLFIERASCIFIHKLFHEHSSLYTIEPRNAFIGSKTCCRFPDSAII